MAVVPELLRPLRPIVGRVEAWQVRRFGRSALGLLFRTDVLVLTVTGRRSGRPRSTPLAHLPLDDGWLVSGGAGGQATVDWVANLRAAGRASVTVHRATFDVVADEPVGEDYARLREVALRRWPRIAAYERRSRRSVPIFVLRRRG